MLKKVFLILLIPFIFSCEKSEIKENQSGSKNRQQEVEIVSSDQKPASQLIAMNSDPEALELLKMRCYACHNPNTKSHDDIIAPPMAAVKRRYSMMYQSRDEFISAVTRWAINPDENRALMRGAVMQFKVMPKQMFKADELEKIAAYIYDNKVEVPEWFAEHEMQMHKGKGMGRGMGRGMMKNN